MKELFNPIIILILFVLVYCADVALTTASLPRKIIYGLLALLALIYLIIALLVH